MTKNEDKKEEATKALIRINTQMLEGAVRVLGEVNRSLHEQNAALRAEVAALTKELASCTTQISVSLRELEAVILNLKVCTNK